MEQQDKPKSMRALILQGGGALGAYEVGALQGFCTKLIEEDKTSDDREGRPIFDIIAGSSIGAVNATILVDNIINTKNDGRSIEKVWGDAIDVLSSFYEKIMERGGPTHFMWWTDNVFLNNEFFKNFWNNWESTKEFLSKQNEIFYKNPFLPDKKIIQNFVVNSPWLGGLYFWMFPDKWGSSATADLARRYYSYLTSTFVGTPNVLGPAMIQPDMKFLDPFYPTHLFVRYNNNPLAETMKKFCSNEFSIKTKRDDETKEARLLVLAMDVGDFTTPVVFDSFSKQDSDGGFTWFSNYGLDKYGKKKFQIQYDGIKMKHIEASMATPLRYEYPTFQVKNLKDKKTETRTFWDGAFLINTPIRQVIEAHKQYWIDRGVKDIPELEIFIVNLYPATEKGIPTSPDGILDRQIDITFHDRTKFELRVDQMRSDYLEIITELKKIAQKHEPNQVQNILEKNSRKQTEEGKFVDKNDLIENRFSLGRIVYVERTEETGKTIFGKAFDFSPETINNLISNGRDAAKKAFDEYTKSHKEFCKSR